MMSESAAKPNTKLANRGSLVTRFRIGPVLALMLAILTVLLAYLATLTAGHAFIGDDFAAYVMHAVNLAEGHAYHDIRYVTNPAAIGFSPAQGYPPVYPLLLAPVYKIWGLNLHAMKVVTVACFGVSLGVLALLFRARLPQWALSALIGLIGFNIVFWSQHDYLLSESAFLMFSFGALLAAQKIYADLKPKEWRFGAAFLLSVLFYAAYGTRTVGFVLLPALILADVCKFRRPSRFLVMVVTLTAGLILLQNTLLLSPRAYMNAEHISVSMIREHVAFYGKTLSYVWRNGSSKTVQIVMALVFTALSAVAFVKSLWSRRSPVEFYVLGYVAVLIAWATEIGMRGLIPVLPLYFAFGVEGLVTLGARFRRPVRSSYLALGFALIGLAYLGAYRWRAQQTHLMDVRDPEAQQLFAYLKQTTDAGDLLVFQKPRTLALFTDRKTTMLAPGESASDAARFFAESGARFLIQNEATNYSIQELIAHGTIVQPPVFDNSVFQVFSINAGLKNAEGPSATPH